MKDRFGISEIVVHVVIGHDSQKNWHYFWKIIEIALLEWRARKMF
jgi:hypothetical protein